MVGTKYLAGWGYILSQDVVNHALAKVDHWHTHQHEAPGWYNLLDWEDVLMGLLVKDKINSPMEAPGFKAAWRACTNQTAVSHWQKVACCLSLLMFWTSNSFRDLSPNVFARSASVLDASERGCYFWIWDGIRTKSSRIVAVLLFRFATLILTPLCSFEACMNSRSVGFGITKPCNAVLDSSRQEIMVDGRHGVMLLHHLISVSKRNCVFYWNLPKNSLVCSRHAQGNIQHLHGFCLL